MGAIYLLSIYLFNTKNASKHLIDQSKERILLIDLSKNASKHIEVSRTVAYIVHHFFRIPILPLEHPVRFEAVLYSNISRDSRAHLQNEWSVGSLSRWQRRSQKVFYGFSAAHPL